MSVRENGLKVLNSDIDGSINYIYDDNSEFRLVQRADHDTIYLSSHNGCGLSCQMCWLTATGQTQMRPLTKVEILDRGLKALQHADQGQRINFAFMARGDALSNPNVDSWLVSNLLNAMQPNVHAKVTISTIFPQKAVGRDIADFLLSRFGAHQPTIYWSLYSICKSVRQQWLPEASDPDLVVRALREWQDVTFQDVVVHHSLIKGVNDTDNDADSIIQLLDRYALRYRMNLVRFNPPPGSNMKEASEQTYEKHLKKYLQATAGRARVQSRVGFDVKASCGMFVGGELAVNVQGTTV